MLRWSGGRSVTSLSSKYILPSEGDRRPEIQFNKVVLPQPEGPRRA